MDSNKYIKKPTEEENRKTKKQKHGFTASNVLRWVSGRVCVYICVCVGQVCICSSAVVVLHVIYTHTHSDQTDGTPAWGPHGWNKWQSSEHLTCASWRCIWDTSLFHTCSKFRSEMARVWDRSVTACSAVPYTYMKGRVKCQETNRCVIPASTSNRTVQKVENKRYYRQSEFIHVKAHIYDFHQWLVGW